MMKTKRYLPCALFALALAGVLCGCSKESSAEGTPELQAETATINFVTQMAGDTKAATPLPQNAFVGMAILKRTMLNTPVEPNPTTTNPIYKSYTLGSTALEPYNSEAPLSLVKGTYDFYAVAENKGGGQLTVLKKATVNPTLIEVDNIACGKDYVGATLKAQAIAGSTAKTLTLTFDHLATKIDLALAKDASIATLAISKVTISETGPTGNAPVLFISPNTYAPIIAGDCSVDVGNNADMTEVTANSLYSYILLPANSGTLTFKITAQVTPIGEGAVAESRTYTLSYPLSTEQPLLGQKVYKMKATIGLYTVTFDGSAPNVEDWTAGNEETPVVPEEQL